LEQLFNSSGIDYKVLDNNYIVLKSKAEQNFQAVSQQKGSVSGKVVDASGVPLPGVTVAVKGTTQGTITDMDGKYTLTGIPG
jgi:protocatechuate 3,4-dioxygenase beta subunit